MTKERFIELEDLLNRECFKYDKDCNTCPYHGKECKEYEEEPRITANIMTFATTVKSG